MPLLRELGTAARECRQEIGLSQQQLANLAALSRATVSDLENGRLRDLGATRIERLANELGFALGLVNTRRTKDRSAMDAATRIASVPYAVTVPVHALEEAFVHGTVSPDYIPQLRTLLQEGPVAILADIAHELRQLRGAEPRHTWANMRALAVVLKCERPLWQALST